MIVLPWERRLDHPPWRGKCSSVVQIRGKNKNSFPETEWLVYTERHS